MDSFLQNFSLYGLIIGVSILIVLLPVKKSFSNVKNIYFILILIFGLIFGKAFSFAKSVLENENFIILSIHDVFHTFKSSGISLFGVYLGIILASFIVIKKYAVSANTWFSKICIYLPLAQAIGRFGNFFNQELYGPPTNLPWAIYISKINRPVEYSTYEYFHPTFFYESLLNFILFVILFYTQKKCKISEKSTISLYLIGYGLIRLLIGRFRIDNYPVISVFGYADIFSIIFIILGLIIQYGKSYNYKSKITS